MSPAIRDESWFPFLRQGTPEATAIGNWARAAFLPPETLQVLLKSLMCEWLEAGADPEVAANAEATALASYEGKRIPRLI